MLTANVVRDAISMTADGASQKDLYTFLFVPKDDFLSWFSHGRDLVNQEYGRLSEDKLDNLQDIGELQNFDVLCLLLYKGVMQKRWQSKKEMHRLVASSSNPQLAFKYLEAVYYDEFNPRYAEPDKDEDDIDSESATTFIMDEFLRESQRHASAHSNDTNAETEHEYPDAEVSETEKS